MGNIMLSSNFLLALLLCIGSIGFSHGELWTALHYPNPMNYPNLCNMPSQSRLCDPDAVLSESDRQRIDQELKKLEERTRQVS